MDCIIFETSAGWVGIAGSKAGISQLILPRRKPEEVEMELGDSMRHASRDPNFFQDITERLKAYFNGERVDFPVRLDLSGATPFQREVWQAARQIPYGETRSYKWVAARAGKPLGARATGQALGKNPIPIIIPCHRVLASDGWLGGFSGGLDTKRYLLKLEAANPA